MADAISPAAQPLRLVLLGASGLVGSGLLRYIAENNLVGIEVRTMVRKLGAQPPYPFVTEFAGSLEAIPSQLFPAESHVIIHFAVKNSDPDGTGYEAVNVNGTKALLRAMPASSAGIIYGGSLSDYGQGHQRGIDEATPLAPITALANSRVQAEMILMKALRSSGRSAIILRPRLILASREMTLRRMAKMLRFSLAVGSGRQTVSVIDVADYVAIILRLAYDIEARRQSAEPRWESFNVGYLRPISFAELEAAIARKQHKQPPRFRLPASNRFVQLLNATGAPNAIKAASWLDLMGFSHAADVSKLAAEIGGTILSQDPLAVVERILELAKA